MSEAVLQFVTGNSLMPASLPFSFPSLPFPAILLLFDSLMRIVRCGSYHTPDWFNVLIPLIGRFGEKFGRSIECCCRVVWAI